MREMRGEVGEKTPKKEMDNPFLLRHRNQKWCKSFFLTKGVKKFFFRSKATLYFTLSFISLSVSNTMVEL